MSRWSLMVWVPGRPPSPNARYGNVFAQRKETQQWRDAARLVAIDQVNRCHWDVADKVDLRVIFVLPDQRRRDWDNLVAGTKPLVDGLVDARVLTDDSLDVVQTVAYGWRITRNVAGTELIVSRVDMPGLFRR